jgi:diguanylate cyclase (GGDEF)-like protein/PAS domain S-box-containing protein
MYPKNIGVSTIADKMQRNMREVMDEQVSLLIVEENSELRQSLCDILRTEGYRPFAVSTGSEAIREFERIKPIVALIDLKLDDMPGLELMRKIRQDFPKTECILLTEHASRETAIEAVNLGVYSFVEKPYDMDRLLLTIRKAIERRKADEELRRLKEFHEYILQNLAEGIIVDDAEGLIQFVNPAASELLGYSPDELIGQHWSKFCPEDQQYLIQEANTRRARGIHSDRYEIEILRKDGTRVPTQVAGSVMMEGDRLIGTLAVFSDITERKSKEEELRYISNHDSLTGLYNRSYFESQMVKLEREKQFPLGVVMVDVDDLKLLNDSHGHDAGDNILRRTAALLKATFRADDVVARIGGDEFAVLLPGADTKILSNAIARFKKELHHHNAEHDAPALNLSHGAVAVESGISLAKALKEADEQMYQEKLRKGGRPRKRLKFSEARMRANFD